MLGRIIVIDASVMAHKNIFEWERQIIAKEEGRLPEDFIIMNPDYGYVKSIISLLKKIVVQRGDQVILALDARNSWRRAFYPIYKGHRHAFRQSHKLIDWTKEYARIDAVNLALHKGTDWHLVKISDFATMKDLVNTVAGEKFKINDGRYPLTEKFGIEADDIMACCAKFYSDREVILVSKDQDLDQLCYYSNVKIFSTILEIQKKVKGCYKIVNDPLGVLAKKVRTGDKGDNILVNLKADTKEERDIREFIINLITLPTFVENPIVKVLQNLKPKSLNYNELPFQKSLGNPEKFNKIYMFDNQVTWEDGLKLHEKLKIKAEKKKEENRIKAKQKRELKKVKEMR